MIGGPLFWEFVLRVVFSIAVTAILQQLLPCSFSTFWMSTDKYSQITRGSQCLLSTKYLGHQNANQCLWSLSGLVTGRVAGSRVGGGSLRSLAHGAPDPTLGRDMPSSEVAQAATSTLMRISAPPTANP